MIFHQCTVTVEETVTRYSLYEPPRAGDAMPVILFLHGAGEAGSDGVKPTTVGIGPAIERMPERFPALVVFPQASRGYGWNEFNLQAAIAALDDVIAHHDVDLHRVYVTGISMGGYGTWLLALLHPERFAAAVPVCGGLDQPAAVRARVLRVGSLYDQAAMRLASMPQWAFHGDRDNVIPVEESRSMVRALRAIGADVRYTEYPGVRHNSWDRAYAEPELMPWLLAQKRA